MATLSLKVCVVGSNVTKTLQFDPSTIIFDACRIIREKIPEANTGNPTDYGLFLADEDPKKGVWLEPGRSIEYYLLRSGDVIEYRKKQRILRVRMLDGSVKTLQVDDSHTVAQLMITICFRIGITHHEEYSLVQELPEDEKLKTLTLKRDRSIAKDQKKLDEMKRKLHTDDELNWLDHSKTLREQGIDVNETLLLRRKFFFSDQNVDARDPVQLNLLYVQTRDAILKGAHPVTMDEALQFAGMQSQIQFGDYDERKHKPGFLELKEFLPKEYMKIKGVEKKIFGEHKKMSGLSEIDGKVKYTQLARSLKTYGITFFLVKEKMKGKNKLTPRLLGITKDSVVRVDEKTKEILKTWPLTTVKRWAASPNSFTLDFGDYSDSYYSVQTQEGEQISQLIAGYIDIILKKKRAKDHFGIEGDEESTMYEDSVSPAKATIIQHQSSSIGHANIGSVALPAVLRAGDNGQSQYQMGSMQRAQFSQVSNQAHSGHVPTAGQNARVQGMSQAQRAFLGTIDTGMSAIMQAQSELENKATLPKLGSDATSRQWKQQKEDLSKQSVGAQLSAMNAATAQVVTLTSGHEDETDYGAVGSAVATISSNVNEFSKDVKMLAALQEEEDTGDRLLQAARRLAGAFSDLLQAAQPGTTEPRQNLLSAANRIGEASHDIMRKVGEDEDETDRAFEDTLLALAKAVANATAALVLKAKSVASKCENQALQNKVIGSATSCALATSQLVACTKVVAPTIHNPACQEQLVEAAKVVANSVETVVDTSRSATKDDKTLQDLGGAATSVTKALNDLLDHIRTGTGDRDSNDGHVDTILTATDKLFGSMGDTPEMVKQARILAQATSQLVNAIKCQAESHPDSEMQKKLLAAAKLLADATASMVEAAKDSGHENTLRRAAEELCSATAALTTDILKGKQIRYKKKYKSQGRKMRKAVEELSSATQALTSEIIEGYTSDADTIRRKTLRKAAENVCDATSALASDIIEGQTTDTDTSPCGTLSLKQAAKDLCSATNSLANNILEGYTSDNHGYQTEDEEPRTLQRAVKELYVSSHDLTKDIIQNYKETRVEKRQSFREAVRHVARATTALTSDILEGYTSESCASDSEFEERISLKKAADRMKRVTSTLNIDVEDYRKRQSQGSRKQNLQQAARDLAQATNTLASDILEGYSTDASGYTTDGYTTDADGYTTDGYTTDGGYTTEGYTTNGYNTEGYTTDGYTTEGYTTEEEVVRRERYQRRETIREKKRFRTSMKIFAEDLCLATAGLTDTLLEGYQTDNENSKAKKNLETAAQQVVTATSLLTLDILDGGTIRLKEGKKLTQEERQKRRSLHQAVDQVIQATSSLTTQMTRKNHLDKGCASNPQDAEQQRGLRSAAEELRSATNAAAANAMKRKLIKKLESAAKNAAAASTQLINAAQAATPYNKDNASQTQLMQQCKSVADQNIPKLVQGIKGTMASPESAAAQLVLISAAQDMIQPGTRLVTGSKSAVPTITDQPTSMALTNAAKNLGAALAELRAASSKAQEACGSLEIDGAMDQVKSHERELLEIKKTAAAGRLVPLPGETAESCAMQLGTTSKTVGSSMAQLLTAAAQGNENYTGIAARDTANALKVLMQAVRGVAATTNDRALQEKIIDCAIDVMDKSSNLIDEAKKAVNNPSNPDNQTRLAQVAKAVSQALNNCVNCLPGLREVDQSIRQVTTISQRLQNLQISQTNRSFQEVQGQLNNSAVNLNQAASEIVTASRGPPQEVAKSSGRFSQAYTDFMDSGMEFAGATKDPEARTQIVSGMKSVSMTSNKLLIATKSWMADPNAPNAKNLLAQAARQVTEGINHLINICTVSAPGQKECDNALRQIQMMKNVIENPAEPISDASYFECLDGVMEKSKALGLSMTGISNHAKEGELDQFCDSVRNFATSVCGLTESSAQAAYLVGIADPASEPGRPGLVDQSQFARANQAIQMACQNLTNPTSSQQQGMPLAKQYKSVLSAATIVAKHTSALCNTCRLASSKTNNPVAKRHFVQSAKDVANSTANLVKAIKVLDNEFNDENRRKCAEAAKPLVSAVEELTTFACSPEFASVPAKISQVARNAQEPLRSAGVQMIDGACHMVQAAKLLAVNPRDPPTYQQYSAHSKSVSDAIKKLLAAIKECAPGQRECDLAIQNINTAIRDLDQASLAAISQSLPPKDEKSLQGFQDQMMNAAREILESIETIRNSAKNEAEMLGHLVSRLANYMDPLAAGAIGAASKNLNSKQQMDIIDQTKSVAESALQLTFAAKEGGGNPKAVHTHATIDEATDGMKEALQELIGTLEEANSQAGHVTAMIDNIAKAISKTEERVIPSDNMSFVDFQTDMVRLAKQIARTSQDMVGKAGTNVAELGGLANQLTKDYTLLANNSCGAMATCASQDIANRIRAAVQELGKSCMELTQDAGKLQSNPTDSFSKRDLADHARHVTEKVSKVLSALQAGSRGTQACINAASTVSGIIGDLDTTIMFASAGTLNAEGEEAFADHRENILKTAKSLVEDTKTLVSGAASNQEQLAQAAQSAVMTITKLSDCVKHGASSLGSKQPEAQVLLINAVKDVAAALGDLISATKNASGKPAQDPAMSTLKDSAKVMVTNVTSLLKTVKTVEDEAARGTRALEASIEAISQELRNFTTTDHIVRKITPEELIRTTRLITSATAKAVAAGKSCKQDDVITAANIGRKAITDVLNATKGAAAGADSPDIRQRALDSGRNLAVTYKELLDQVNLIIQKPTPQSRQQLSEISKRVASLVTEVIHAAEAIKGSDWVDPDDPLMIAEAELLGAANSIEAASRKLALLQPRKKPKSADESLNFEEQILAAAQSIAAATAALVKAASAAQRELVAQGKVGSFSMDHDEDSQWSEGLISAARMVAAATHSLCDAANAMVQGHASEEKLISSAKQVASSTAQLLVACKVKADSDSVAMRRLQSAGNAVKKATDALVRSAQQASENFQTYEDTSNVNINQRMVGGLAQIIMAQEEILIKERELEVARRKLETIRKAKYKDHPSDDDSSGSAF